MPLAIELLGAFFTSYCCALKGHQLSQDVGKGYAYKTAIVQERRERQNGQAPEESHGKDFKGRA